jgi:hypothetical protein
MLKLQSANCVDSRLCNPSFFKASVLLGKKLKMHTQRMDAFTTFALIQVQSFAAIGSTYANNHIFAHVKVILLAPRG